MLEEDAPEKDLAIDGKISCGIVGIFLDRISMLQDLCLEHGIDVDRLP